MAATKTDADYLEEARWICRRVPTVWFIVDRRRDAATQQLITFYRIFRRNMGQVAERSSLPALVSFLRKQLPPP